MLNVIHKLMFLLEIGNHQFDSILWKTRPEKRKALINHIFKFKIPIGKSKKEICELFGNDPNIYICGTWSYPIELDRFGNSITSLLLYFENEIVVNINLKVRK